MEGAIDAFSTGVPNLLLAAFPAGAVDPVTAALLFIALLVLVVLVAASIRVVNEYERLVVFKLGRLQGVKGPGVVFVVPGIFSVQKVDLRTITYDARRIAVVTKDNVRCDIDSFVYYRVVDSVKAVCEVENYIVATQNLAKTALRDVLSSVELDDLLTKTEELAKQIQMKLDEMTEAWGVKVSAVVISDVVLPAELQRALAKQAEAERERRARIIVAEGEYLAAEKMVEAAKLYAQYPISLRLRELQTLTEIAREKNLIVITSTTGASELGAALALARSATGGKAEKQTSERAAEATCD